MPKTLRHETQADNRGRAVAPGFVQSCEKVNDVLGEIRMKLFAKRLTVSE